MRNDHQLQKAVLDQLGSDPSIDACHIGVWARNGVVTLSGHVPSFGEKRAAERAAGQVKGVKAIVDEIAIERAGICQTGDEQLAERAFARLASNRSIPMERIHLNVEKGVVTLRGEVDGQSQRQAAQECLNALESVREVINEITLKHAVEPGEVRDKIHEALARVAPTVADRIGVMAEGSRITLVGTVPSWHEKGLAESAAWSVPGVTEVVDDIAVA